jgi:hypothetical protein
MFDLEAHIATWRESFKQQKLDEQTLTELESHLRDAFAREQRKQATSEQAWQQAITGLGDAKGIAMEFRKAPHIVWWPTLFAVGLVFATGATAAFALTLKRGVHTNTDALLLTHVTAVTIGYTAMFATGLLAICSVLQRAIKRWDPVREAALSKYTRILSIIAVVTVTVGILLGALWASKMLHAFWSWDPREIGGALVLVWAICQVEIFRRPGLSPAFRLTAGFVANLVTALAWFGPVVLELRRSYGSDGIAPTLAGFIALNVLLALLAWWLPQTKGADVESIKVD